MGPACDQGNRHAEPARAVPGVRSEEVYPGLHLQPLWSEQPPAFPGRCEHRRPAFPLRGLQEGGRDPVLHVSLPLRPGHHGAALLHRLRPGGTARHEPVPLCAVDQRGGPAVVYGDGQQSRDFTYVDDIARGTIAAVHYLQTADSRRPSSGELAVSGRWSVVPCSKSSTSAPTSR
jgi:hypothetical protein